MRNMSERKRERRHGQLFSPLSTSVLSLVKRTIIFSTMALVSPSRSLSLLFSGVIFVVSILGPDFTRFSHQVSWRTFSRESTISFWSSFINQEEEEEEEDDDDEHSGQIRFTISNGFAQEKLQKLT